MKNTCLVLPGFLVLMLFGCVSPGRSPTMSQPYAVVVSRETMSQPGWAAVVEALRKKHKAEVVIVPAALDECSLRLKQLQPRHVCFVARPQEVSTDIIRAIHKLSRGMDEDPYADFLWGIITGWGAEDALRIAQTSKPLTVRVSLSTTGVNLDLMEDGLILDDGKQGVWTRRSGGKTTQGSCDGVTSPRLFLDYWNEHEVDLLVTSGHATQVNLEMPFGLGSVVCASNRLYALDKTNFVRWVRNVSRGTASGGYWFATPDCEKYRQTWAGSTTAPMLRESRHPKVVLAAGNCLIADTMGTSDSMIVTWLSAGGVSQFVGYTVATWYGQSGWGTLDMWTTSAGHITLSEAAFLNNQRILWRLQKENPRLLGMECPDENLNSKKNRAVLEEIAKAPRDRQRDQLGMVYDRDVLVLFGDPKWEARLDAGKQMDRVGWAWKSNRDGSAMLTLRARDGFSKEALPILLPQRMPNGEVEDSAGLAVMLNDEFILFQDLKMEKGRDYVVKIRPGK